MKSTARHIPAGYQLLAKDERFNFEVHSIASSGRHIAICFRGKATKPAWHYSFKSVERMMATVEETLRSEIDAAERKAKRSAEKKAACASHDVKVKDIFRCSWGYDQTNVDYYEVVAVSGQMATVRAIGAISESTGWEQGESVPQAGHFIGQPFRVRIQKWNMESEPYFKVNSFSNAYRMKPVAIVANTPVYEASHWTAYA